MSNEKISSANRFRFRAWHKNTGKMIDLLKITPFAAGDLPGVFVPFDPALVLMQSTGLTDAKGKEIYESDILCIRSKYQKDAIRIYAVEWKYDRWEIVSHNKTYFTGIKPYFEIPEVIGNVWENPSLLS